MIHVQGFPAMQLTLLKIQQTPQQVFLHAEHSSSESPADSISEFSDFHLRCSHPINSEVESIHLEFNGAYLSQIARQPQKREIIATAAPPIEQRSGLQIDKLESCTREEKRVTEFRVSVPRTSFEGKMEIESLSWKAIFISESQQRRVAQFEMALPTLSPRRLAKSVLESAK